MRDQRLYDALETSLSALDRGEDIESCLARFPHLADELRPILVASLDARRLASTSLPEGAQLRSRARLLNYAAELREQKRHPILSIFRPFTSGRLARLALTVLLVAAFLLSGGTGLVSASNGSLPGDQLYPVKRSLEGVQLFFAFDHENRQKLEDHFEEERVREIEELYTEGRMEQVDFTAELQSQQGDIWVVGGLTIRIDDEAIIPAGVVPGAIIHIVGETDDGIIKAEQVILLSTPVATPGLLPIATSAPTQPSAPSDHDNLKENSTPEPGETEDADDDQDEDSETQTEAEQTLGAPTQEETSKSDDSKIEPTPTPKPDDDDSQENTATPKPGDDEPKDPDPTDKPTDDGDD